MIDLASYTIGPKIGLDGEADFRKSLNNINNTLRTHDSELKKVSSLYAENGKSEEALKAKNEVLNKSITEQEKKITEVKKALEYSKSEYGANADQTLKWQRVLNNAETDLNNLKNEVKKNEKALNDMEDEVKNSDKALDDFGDSADKSSNKCEKLSKAVGGIGSTLKVVGGAVVGAGAMVAGGISAINEITDSTREYREDIGKLETAFKTAGISQGVATETYKAFFSVLGEEDRSVEAVNHLAKLTKNQTDLKKWTDICAGVWGTFGDSLPIEGLTEAANETAKVGQVTGPLADALNWAGVSEDAFNEKLAKCNTEQERAALITNTLNGLYKEAAKNYKKANGEIMNAQRAQSELTDATAKMGDALEPVSTGFKLLGADIINELAPSVEIIGDGLTEVLSGNENAAKTIGEGLSGIIDSVGDISEKIMPIITSILTTLIPGLITVLVDALPEISKFGTDILITLIDGIGQSLPMLTENAVMVIMTLASGLISAIPNLLAVIPQVLFALIDGLTENFPLLIQSGIDMLGSLGQGMQENLPTLINTALDSIDAFADMLTENLPLLIDAGIQMLLGLVQGISESLPTLIEKVPEIVSKFANLINDNMPTILFAGLNIIITLVKGIIEAIPTLVQNIPKIITAIVDVWQAMNWMNLGKNLITGIKNGISKMVSGLSNSGKSIVDTIISAIKDLPSKALTWGKDFMMNLINGIKSMASRLGKIILEDVVGSITEYLHFSIPDKGPLRDVPNWMPDMIDLLVDGIEDNEYRVSQAAKSLADIVNDEMSINADVKNVGYGDNIIVLNSTTNLDGVAVANSTQRIVTNQQTASNKARGVA